ncbi:MAG: hypothetical protein EZS28_029686, partial [Streblomastix strix]
SSSDTSSDHFTITSTDSSSSISYPSPNNNIEDRIIQRDEQTPSSFGRYQRISVKAWILRITGNREERHQLAQQLVIIARLLV